MHVKTVHERGVARPGRPPSATGNQKQEMFKCRECGKEFLRFYDMNRHRLTHSNTRPHKCSRCGKGFARADALMRHQRPENGCHRRFMEEVEATQNRVVLKASGHLSAQRPGLIGPEFIPIVNAPHQSGVPAAGPAGLAPSTTISPNVPIAPVPSGALPPPPAPGNAANPAMPSPSGAPPPPSTNAWQIIQELTSRINVLEMRISQQDSRIAYLEYNHQKQSQQPLPQPQAPPQPGHLPIDRSAGLGPLGDMAPRP